MEIAFSDRRLRNMCEKDAYASKNLGATPGEKLRRRIADLRAAQSVFDVVAGRPTKTSSCSGDEISISINSTLALIVAVGHPKVPRLASGEADWNRVSRIKVVRLEEAV